MNNNLFECGKCSVNNLKNKHDKYNPVHQDCLTVCNWCEELAYDEEKARNQTAKADNGKLRFSLIPPQALEALAAVREYGCSKYHDPENWRLVEKQRYIDAAWRHWVAYIKDNKSLDAESALPHIDHLFCNIMFLVSMEGG